MSDKDLFLNYKDYLDTEVELKGWIKNHRKQKEFGFISFSDGTFFTPIQIVYDNSLDNLEIVVKIILFNQKDIVENF